VLWWGVPRRRDERGMRSERESAGRDNDSRADFYRFDHPARALPVENAAPHVRSEETDRYDGPRHRFGEPEDRQR
jgi:hypothetical protein